MEQKKKLERSIMAYSASIAFGVISLCVMIVSSVTKNYGMAVATGITLAASVYTAHSAGKSIDEITEQVSRW